MLGKFPWWLFNSLTWTLQSSIILLLLRFLKYFGDYSRRLPEKLIPYSWTWLKATVTVAFSHVHEYGISFSGRRRATSHSLCTWSQLSIQFSVELESRTLGQDNNSATADTDKPVFSIVALKSQSGVFGIPCGAENYLGRVEKTRFSTTWIKTSWENIKIWKFL